MGWQSKLEKMSKVGRLLKKRLTWRPGHMHNSSYRHSQEPRLAPSDASYCEVSGKIRRSENELQDFEISWNYDMKKVVIPVSRKSPTSELCMSEGRHLRMIFEWKRPYLFFWSLKDFYRTSRCNHWQDLIATLRSVVVSARDIEFSSNSWRISVARSWFCHVKWIFQWRYQCLFKADASLVANIQWTSSQRFHWW